MNTLRVSSVNFVSGRDEYTIGLDDNGEWVLYSMIYNESHRVLTGTFDQCVDWLKLMTA